MEDSCYPICGSLGSVHVHHQLFNDLHQVLLGNHPVEQIQRPAMIKKQYTELTWLIFRELDHWNRKVWNLLKGHQLPKSSFIWNQYNWDLNTECLKSGKFQILDYLESSLKMIVTCWKKDSTLFLILKNLTFKKFGFQMFPDFKVSDFRSLLYWTSMFFKSHYSVQKPQAQLGSE